VAFVRTRIDVPLANTMTNLSATNDGLEGEMIQRETAEAALRESESTLRSILETAADGIIVIDERGSILTFNHAAEVIFGHRSADVLGRNITCLMPPPYAQRHDVYIANFLQTGKARIMGKKREVVGLRKDGRAFPMEVAVGESQLGGQKIFSGIVRDLEQDRRKDEQLNRHLKVFHDATDPIVIADLEGRMIEINNEAVREYGYSRDELLGESIKTLVPPDRHLEMDELLERCRAGEKVRSVEATRRTKSGEIIPALITLSLLADEAGQPVAIASFVKDISEFKNLQEQLFRAQKLEAIAILAGGIAHDFNNLLTSIRGSSEILIDHLEPGGRLARCARRIEKATDRATALTTRILGFSRKQVTQQVTLNLNQTVREIHELFERTLAEDVEFKTDLSVDALHIRADESQLAQVLMNLVVNAGDAMPTGGKLRLTTTREEVLGDRARSLDIPPGRFVALRVQDNGQGIPPETLSQIYDPFFTTKEVGKGTGLGLSTADGIIREHGGAIAVESEVGVGTLFTILLPEVEASPIEEEATSEVITRPQTSGETILLVEDDDIMREVVGEILEEEGYVVVIAADPDEALAQSREQDGQVALVVTDVVMPIMSGFLLAKKLRGQYPHIRVLYMSGYTDQVLADRGDLKEDDPFIRKPFGSEAFLSKVREVLDSRLRDPA
jgi:PAS domain S-box-containing protein